MHKSCIFVYILIKMRETKVNHYVTWFKRTLLNSSFTLFVNYGNLNYKK